MGWHQEAAALYGKQLRFRRLNAPQPTSTFRYTGFPGKMAHYKGSSSCTRKQTSVKDKLTTKKVL